jgi:holo-[acyl-carrier protein] synthase
MIVGTGIDIAEVPRIAESIERFGERFLRRIYTEDEIRYCDSKANRVERYAARFAAKEAAMRRSAQDGVAAYGGATLRLSVSREAGRPSSFTAKRLNLRPG